MRSKLPLAVLLAVAAWALLALGAYVGVRLQSDTSKKTLVFVGDSFTGNYRFAKPQRLQDLAETALAPTWQVFNYGRPGAFALDILLQLQEAQRFSGRVDAVVLPLFVSKFLVTGPYARLDERGDNLRWLRLDSTACDVVATFGTELWKKLVIHKAGLLFAVYDLLQYAYIEAVQSPQERDHMRTNPPERRVAIEAHVIGHARTWDTATLAPATFLDSPAARDFRLFVAYAKTEHIPLLIALIPNGDPEEIALQFSPRAKANLDMARVQMLDWCQQQGVAAVDLTDRLGGHVYDDFTHLKDVRGNRVIVDAVQRWVAGGTQLVRQLAAAPQASWAVKRTN